MSPQSSIAHYRLIDKLGEGGMGEVWRATDTKLHRDVAVKILPDAFARDPDRMARFQREAQVLASLNHPNIAAVYGVEERAIVLELVDGPTLAERIAQGPVPLDEALEIARQIGDALQNAHDCGVIHRDLKPANIKLTGEGRVKVLDFGLAKAMGSDSSTSSTPVDSPTLTIKATAAGIILGTAAYMAPEQAKGKNVDKRADIWAYGVVLYEMLTGRSLFSGETISDTLAAVLTKEPDWNRVPPEVRRLLQGCLERDPKRRLRDIGDVWRLLDSPVSTEKARTGGGGLGWKVAAVLLALVAGTLAVVHFVREQPAAAPVIRFGVPSPEKAVINGTVFVSPDGKNIAYAATGWDGLVRIWVRPLDALNSRILANGDQTTVAIFWTADSRSVVFQAGGKIRRVDVAGANTQTVCNAPPVLLGGAWSPEGTILFGTNNGPIYRVAASGGDVTPMTQLDRSRGETFHTDPIFLPDGKHFLYFRHSSKTELQGIYVGSVDAKPGEQNLNRIEATDFSPGYSPAPQGSSIGHLLFLREDALMAEPFDEKRLTKAGEATAIAEKVGTNLTRAFFSVSHNGVLAYRGGSGGFVQMTRIDREGRTLDQAFEGTDYQDLAISPDRSRIAYSRMVPGAGRQVWMADLARKTQTRFSFAKESVRSPTWSPDGRHLAFSGMSSNKIYVKDTLNGGEAEVIAQTDSPNIVTSWSPDGKYLVFTLLAGGYDLMALSNPRGGGERKILPIVNSEFNELHPQISPDSRWISYTSNETGRNEIYVRPFPPGDGRAGQFMISSNGGQQARWKADGKELYYLGLNRAVMAVPISTGQTVRADVARTLFTVPGIQTAISVFQYDVFPDGKQFLVITPSEAAMASPASVVVNWQAAR